MTFEEDARRAACIEMTFVLGGHDRPQPLERILGVLRELEP